MSLVGAFGRHVQNVGWVGFFPSYPVFYFLAESTHYPGGVPPSVRFAEVSEPCVVPIPHRNHNCLLIDGEFLLFGKVKTSLPRVPEAVWPLAGVTVFLVPDILFRPKPSTPFHFQDQFNDIGMALTIDGYFLNVQDERPRRLQHPL